MCTHCLVPRCGDFCNSINFSKVRMIFVGCSIISQKLSDLLTTVEISSLEQEMFIIKIYFNSYSAMITWNLKQREHIFLNLATGQIEEKRTCSILFLHKKPYNIIFSPYLIIWCLLIKFLSLIFRVVLQPIQSYLLLFTFAHQCNIVWNEFKWWL